MKSFLAQLKKSWVYSLWMLWVLLQARSDRSLETIGTGRLSEKTGQAWEARVNTERSSVGMKRPAVRQSRLTCLKFTAWTAPHVCRSDTRTLLLLSSSASFSLCLSCLQYLPCLMEGVYVILCTAPRTINHKEYCAPFGLDACVWMCECAAALIRLDHRTQTHVQS